MRALPLRAREPEGSHAATMTQKWNELHSLCLGQKHLRGYPMGT